MKYTQQEQLALILQRSETLWQRKNLRVTRGLSATAGVLLCALAFCIGSLGWTGLAEARTVYGSFLLSPDTGGYVLVAVLAFAVGIVVAALIHRRGGRGRPQSFLTDKEKDV